jgi:hypothetical protein
MELVLATLHLSWMGGATTYLLTVASALQRLGHEVTLYSPDAAATAAHARDRGLRVATDPAQLPPECDAVLAQDTAVALELADRYPGPQVFVSHGFGVDLAMPPQLPGLTAAVVAMNDRVAAQARALAVDAPVVRLRQPIDIERFRFRGPVRERPRKALLLGNYLRGDRRALIAGVCAELGIEWVQQGREGDGIVVDPADAIAQADIVIGYGRSILEAMACGRPAYVYDHSGADGWVTPDSYPALERDGFTGMASGKQAARETLACDLAAYPRGSGISNYHLAWAHHSAGEHAQQLATLLERVAGSPPHRSDSAAELARLVRTQWHADWRAQELGRELELAHGRALELEQRAELAESRAAEADDYRRRFEEVARSARWRLAQTVMRPLDRVRRR